MSWLVSFTPYFHAPKVVTRFCFLLNFDAEEINLVNKSALEEMVRIREQSLFHGNTP